MVLIVSVMLVATGVLSATRFSKLPPVAPVMCAETVLASRYTSSVGASTETLPDEAPAAMLICAPLLRVIVTGAPAAALRLAV